MSEQTKLQQYEAVIERGLQTFVDVGNALLAVRDDPDKLYRSYGTFEDYCRKRWHLSQTHAYRLIGAADVVENLKDSTVGQLPKNVEQTKPLAPLAPEQQRAAWQEAVATAPNGKVTGAHVAAVVDRYTQPKPPALGVEPVAQEEVAPPSESAEVELVGSVSETPKEETVPPNPITPIIALSAISSIVSWYGTTAAWPYPSNITTLQLAIRSEAGNNS